MGSRGEVHLPEVVALVERAEHPRGVADDQQRRSRLGAQPAQERERLTVIDDGCGIDDFQRLLTFNESG